MSYRKFINRIFKIKQSEVIITQLQNEVQELSTINNQLRLELTRLNEENCNEKERQQGLIVQLSSFQKELEQKDEYIRQLEETRVETERNLEIILKQENDLKSEISRLNSALQQQNEEIRRLEHGKKQYVDELQKHKDESSKLISQLKTDMQSLKEENLQIQATQVNGSVQENKHEVEILNLHNELSSMKTQLSQAEKKNESELKAANALAVKLQDELKELEKRLEDEKTKLEEQKAKNNELRTRNWKVMEALNAAESKIKTNTQTKSDKDIQKEFVKRLFPEIKELESVSEEDSEKYIRKYIDGLRKQNKETEDLHKLKSQIQHYKNVIDNTEKMLNKLQKHIEQEEINWRMQLAAKTAELEAVKESYGQELREKLTRVEAELRAEQVDKQKIITQFQELKSTFHNGLQKLPEEEMATKKAFKRDNFFQNVKPTRSGNDSKMTHKKPFDKKKWRLQKYSNRKKLDDWEDRRKKAIKGRYKKEKNREVGTFDVNKIYEEEEKRGESEDVVEEESVRKKKAFKKPHERFSDKKEENKRRRDEFIKAKAEREEALKEYKMKKIEKYKKLNKKTRHGQPVMKERMEFLLEKIQKSVA